jgi:hypothetical protein
MERIRTGLAIKNLSIGEWGDREWSPAPDGSAELKAGIRICENHLGGDEFNGRGPTSLYTLEGTAWIFTSDIPPPGQ